MSVSTMPRVFHPRLGVTVMAHPLAPDLGWKNDDVIAVSLHTYRAIEWEISGRLKWEGRDWRRLKRERRRFLGR